jgi:DNA-binding GntR family transcriptional regulator
VKTLKVLNFMENDQTASLTANKGLANQAYDNLVDLILTRELKQGDQVQERALALKLGLSRTPLREAMHRLEGERILERKSNNRLFVRLVTLQEIMETLHVRRVLEGEAAARSAGKIPQEILQALHAEITELLCANDPAHPRHQTIDGQLHGLISEFADNELLAKMIDDLRKKTRMFSLKRLDNRMASVCVEHLAIIDALLAGDAQAATQAVQQHIEGIRLAIINKLTK